MARRSKKNDNSKSRLDPMIIVALIGLIGTLLAALLASPLLEKWLSSEPSTASPAQNTTNGTPTVGNHIKINQTVTGTLYGSEAGVWIFSDGPAYVTILLDVTQFGSALLIVRDPSGVDQAYVDEQSPGVARLVNFFIPTDEDYTILVRNAQNEQVNYTLTVQDPLTPAPP